MSRSDLVGRARAVGIMSGTSSDGADAAVVEIDRGGARRHTKLLAFASRPYGDELRHRVLGAQEGTLPLRELFRVHVEVAEVATAAAREALAQAPAGPPPEVVGYHGQTVFHDPHGERSGKRVTVQIGEPALLAAALGVTIVSNFRMADLLAGGEGAPLVPLFDYHQLASDTRDRVLVNLGGIANLTRLRAGAPLDETLAFDCGPGNMLLDGIVGAFGPAGSRYDAGGALAKPGHVAEQLLRYFLSEPFFERTPPKSAGREEFGAGYLSRFIARTDGLSLADRLRTACALTAAAVARGIEQSGPRPPDELFVSGGGARNATLVEEIEARTRIPVASTDTLGVPSNAKEAMAFAFLAFESLRGRPGNVPSATGAKKAVVLGSFTPPPGGRR
ncbi:MAG TPA: anhydro-N-acetylmuramic acid kinase [Candidatus Eisenbacteria bacterium]|nr:anhydro-N-acetylmuramic acid kinase [Candidatus Eisenbacteria bacterium]